MAQYIALAMRYIQHPLTYSKIGIIEDDIVIRKILVHLGLWDTRNHDPPWPGPDTIHDFIPCSSAFVERTK